MAIQNINPLIDATSPEQQQEALLSTATEDLDAGITPPVLDAPDIANPEADTVFTGEETQVAAKEEAVKGAIKIWELIRGAPERTAEAPSLRKPAEVEPEVAEQILETTPEMPVTGKPPETVFNLNRIQGPEELKQHIEAVAQASGAADIGKVSFDELTAKAIADGYDKRFVENIININKNIEADPTQVYKMMLALSDAQTRSFDLAKKVQAASDAGNLTDDLMLEFRQAVALEGLLAKGAKQKQANIARSLAIFGQVRQGDVVRGPEMADLVTSLGGRGDFVALARAYTSTPSKTKRLGIAERSLPGTVKDVWMTTWINGLLSSPITHVKNMTANTLFAGLSFAEKQTASLFGQARRLMFGSQDIIRQQEVMVDMYSMAQGIREGWALGKEAWKQNKQITGLSKVEYRTIDDPFNITVADDASDFQKNLAKGWGYYGKFITAPGRALMAEDEFFKAFNYRRSLNSLAFREHSRYFDELVESGMDVGQAKSMADDRMASVLSNPPDEIHREALDFAGEMTFTKDLEGRLASMERIANHPLAKIYVPFIRTPTNIAIEFSKRTPVAFLSKRAREDWAAGGVKRDMVMARATLGSSVMFGIGSMAMEGDITGAGPYRKEDQDVLKAQGWQPYSFVLDLSDTNEEQINKFRQITSVSVGKDKVYISYLGLEPVGSLLGVGATVGEYSVLEPDVAAMEQIFTGAGIGVSDYMSQLPVVSGLSELMTTFRGRGQEGIDYLYNIMSRLSQQGAEVAIGGTPVPGVGAYSSMLAYTNRIFNPDIKSPIPEQDYYSDLNPGVKGVLDAIAMYRNRNPFLSGDRPNRLDSITGQELSAPNGAWLRAFPLRINEGKYSPAHQVLDAFGVGQYQPKKKLNGVQLNAGQYNRLIELATQEPIFDGKTLEMALADLIVDEPFIRFAEENAVEAQRIVKGMVEDAYSHARMMLKEEDPTLSLGIEKREIQEGMQIEQRIQRMVQ